MYYEEGDDFTRAGEPLASYAFRKSDEDTRNPVYQEMSAQTQNLLVEAEEATATLEQVGR